MKIRDLLILAGCLGAASHASALSLGASQGNVILGSPLDLSFQVRPDAGLSAEHSCITAAIRMGDNLVGDNAVNVLFNGSDRVRIRGRHPVNEPVVTIELSAGCDSSVRRSYTFFSDPPQEFIHSATPLRLPEPPPVVSIPLDSPAVQRLAPRAAAPSNAASAARAPATRQRPTPPPAPAPAPKPATAQPAAAQAAPAAAAPAPASAPAAAAPTPPAAAQAPAPQPAAVPAPAPAAAPATGQSQPTLRMEPLDSLGAAPALGSLAGAQSPNAAALPGDAAAGATAPSGAADAAAATLLHPRMAELEGMLQRMLDQQKLDRQQMLTLQTQLQQAQTPQGLPAWVLAMMGLLGLSAGTILWLLHRVRTEKTNSERWAQAVQTAGTPTPPQPDQSAPAPAAAFSDSIAAPAPLSSGTVLPPVLATEPTSSAMFPDSATQLYPLESAHAFASVQEQAEFFNSLGQHQQAIELLHNHLLQNTRTSPKGYLWLLKLLADQDRHEEFGRTRANFEQRFNVVVPEFTAYHRKGRSLQEGYPDVLEQIEAAWPHSDTLTLLRSLLTRADNGPAAQRRFELQAFDELLALYDAAATTPPAQRGALPLRQPTPAPAAPVPEAPTLDAAPAAPVWSQPASIAGAGALWGSAALTELGTSTSTTAQTQTQAPADSASAAQPVAGVQLLLAPEAASDSLHSTGTTGGSADHSDSGMLISLDALNANWPDDVTVTTMAPATPAFAPATSGAPSWVKQAAPSSDDAALELPALQGLEMLELPASGAASASTGYRAATPSPFGGPQLSAPDDSLLQSLQLDVAGTSAPIASTPAASSQVTLAMNAHTMPMLDLNDFLSSSTAAPQPEPSATDSATEPKSGA